MRLPCSRARAGRGARLMKILVVGSGGREHALTWAIAASPLVDRLYCAPGNAGIAEEAECVPVAASDTAGLIAFCKKAAIDFVRRANITGNVFNSYNFGGYLIFVGIPTFIDGRALLFGDDFVQRYFDTVNLVDINKSFEVLDEYRVQWVLLRPTQPLAKALDQDALWNNVYSDEYSVVFVRRH